jgi:SMC interacting uncharacterized protein involved in chromosome segregation
MNQLPKCRKVRFNSRKFAELHIIEKEKHSKSKTDSQPYECKICNSWHITSLKISIDDVLDLVKEVSRLKKELNNYNPQSENKKQPTILELLKIITSLKKDVNYYKSLLGVLRSQFDKEKQKSSSLIQTQRFEIERMNEKLNGHHPITNANSSSEGL